MTDFNFFANCTTDDEARKRYLQLSKIYHTDVEGGDKETMQTINDQYAAFIGKSRAAVDAPQGLPEGILCLPASLPVNPIDETADFVRVVGILVALPGIHVELCGCWLWVSGDTKAVKDDLKNAGLHFQGKKQMWYWCPPESIDKKHKRRRTTDMASIRAKYGSRSLVAANED